MNKIFIFSLATLALISCSQNEEIIEDFKAENSSVSLMRFGVKMMGEESNTQKHKIRPNGTAGNLAYYKWTEGDLLGVVCPDAASEDKEGNQLDQRNVYKIETTTTDWSGNEGGFTGTLERVMGSGMYYDNNKADQNHRVYAACPAGEITITSFDELQENPLRVGCSFTTEIKAQQIGIVEKADEEGNYLVGDWSQAKFVCLQPVIPSDGFFYFLMRPVFSCAEIGMVAPEGGCKITKVELKVQPKYNGSYADVDICGKLDGKCHLIGTDEFYISEMTTSGNKENVVTLSVGETGQALNGGKKLDANIFLIPNGDPSSPLGAISKECKIQIKVTYEVGGNTISRVAILEKSILVGGKNYINLGTLPTE